MLRNGVREYILKPIEREKITEILKKSMQRIESRKEKEENNQKIGYQQMRHLMLSDEISGEEQRTIESQYADHFIPEIIMCAARIRSREENCPTIIIFS